MIPILYSKTETDFTSNGLGRLADAQSAVATEERNGIFELEIVYPVWGTHFNDIEVDCYIKTICNAKKQNQLFRVYSITKPINGKCTIRAEHVSYQMLHIPLMPFTAVGAMATFSAIPQNTVGDNPFTFYTNVESERRFSLYYPKSLRGALQGDQWSILQNFGGEYEWDNFNVRLLVQRGADNGVVLRYGKNITDLKQEENIQQTYTGIVPYWYGYVGEEQKLVTLPEKVLWSQNASNFPYTRALTVDLTDQIENEPTTAELRAAGQAYIERNDIGIPAVSISLSFVDLSQTDEYKDLAPEMLNLCDIITVKFEELGISKQAKITRTKYDILRERYTNLYIGESYHSLASIIANNTAEISASQVIASNRITSAVEKATTVINGSLVGASQKTITDANGNPVGTIWMDSTDESTAVNCIRINVNGMGFTTSGANGPYDTAIYYDSTLGKWVINSNYLNVVNINADNITSGTISADSIVGGTLTASGINVQTDTSTYDVIVLRYAHPDVGTDELSLAPAGIKVKSTDVNSNKYQVGISSTQISLSKDSTLRATLRYDTGLKLFNSSGTWTIQVESASDGGSVSIRNGSQTGRVLLRGIGNYADLYLYGSNGNQVHISEKLITIGTTSNANGRVQLDAAGLRFYNSSGTLTRTIATTKPYTILTGDRVFNSGYTTITDSSIKSTSHIFVQEYYKSSSGAVLRNFIVQPSSGSATIYCRTVTNGASAVPSSGLVLSLRILIINT